MKHTEEVELYMKQRLNLRKEVCKILCHLACLLKKELEKDFFDEYGFDLVIENIEKYLRKFGVYSTIDPKELKQISLTETTEKLEELQVEVMTELPFKTYGWKNKKDELLEREVFLQQQGWPLTEEDYEQIRLLAV